MRRRPAKIPPLLPTFAALISVALCTHNGARYLGAQLRSICAQSLPPTEIVLSDDASSDETVSLARDVLSESLANRPGITIELRILENQSALRVTKNFEQAVRACKGELIALSDQDDVWHPDRLRIMAAEFERRPGLTLLHSDARLVDDAGQPLGQALFQALEVRPFELEWIHAGRAFGVLLRRNLVTGATAMFRRSLLGPALPFPREWLHDEWLAAIAAVTGEVDALEQQLIDYRQHASNAVGASRPTLTQNLRRAFASRGNKQHERLRRVERLMERLEAIAAPKSALDAVQAKLAHQRFRAALPDGRLFRVLPIAREAFSGRYDRYDRGLQAVAADLFESP